MRLALASALLFAVAAPAFAADTHQFQADGATYSYTAERRADGAIALVGHENASGDSFVLKIRDGRVNGQFGVSPVSFVVSPKMMARLDREVATTPVETASN